MYNILICDDERDIVNALKIYLTDPDYRMFEAYTGREALEIVEREDIHLILMDIMMPEMDGISAMVKIRESCNVPVILLTAKSEDMDKILGLNAGADDYITKPFNPIEVGARVRSQLRRYFKLGGGELKPEVLVNGGIEVNDRSKQVAVDGVTVSLTPKEYEILKLLMENPGKALSREEILDLVWGRDYFGELKIVDVNIRRLRLKIEDNATNPTYITTVWGYGYKWEA